MQGLEGFPDPAHDDEVDASNGFLEMLNRQMKSRAAERQKGRLMRRQLKAQTLAPLAGNRGFESAFPPAATICGAAPLRRHPARPGAPDQGAPAEVYAFPATTFVEPARSHYTRIQLKTLCASAT